MKTHFMPSVGALSSKFGICAVAALIAVGTSISKAQNAIGINMAGRQWSANPPGQIEQTLASTDTAGVVQQQNWNNVLLDGYDSGGLAQISGPNAGVVSDNSGAATGVTFSYTRGASATEWAVDQTTHTGNQQLLDGYWDIQGTGTGTNSFGNIPYSLYDVYVYVSSDGNGRTGSVDLNGGPQTYFLTDANGYNYSTNLIQATATTQGSAASAQYVLFTNVTGSSFQVVLKGYGQDVGLAGIQIVDISGAYKPAISAQPASEVLYTGRTAQFTVSASGTAPFYYHWRTNGVFTSDGGNISGAMTNVLIVTNISTANAGNYDVVVTNLYGATTSQVAQLTVVTATLPYEQAILSNNPVAYYRLNEDNGDPTSTPNLPAFDYIGGENGIYGVPTENLADGINGPQPSDGYPGFEIGNGAALFFATYNTSQITVPSWNINTNTVTIAAWVYPMGAETPNAGLVINRGANVAGLIYGDNTNAIGDYMLGYIWNNDGNTYNWNSGLVPPQNQWSLVVLVVTPASATIYLANTNGINAAVHSYPHVAQSFSGPIAIGNDPFATDGSRVFNGEMDEVAVFNQALSQSQVLALFSGASGLKDFPPQVVNQPVSESPNTQQNARFSVTALGASPLSYQWQTGTNGTYVNLTDGGRISGSQTAALTISNVSLSDPTSFLVIVTNLYGSITSSPAVLTVTVSSYWNAASAYGPIAYYPLNETANPASGGVTAFDYQGGFNGLYGADVQNGYNGIMGPQPAGGFLGFPTNNWAAQIIPNDPNGHVTVTPWNLNTNTVSFTCWIRPTGVEPSWAGLVFCRGPGLNAAGNPAGLNFSSIVDASNNKTLTYTWGNTITGSFSTQFAPPLNQWSFVALTVTPTNETIYMFNNTFTNIVSGAGTNGVLPFTDTTMIGGDPYDPSGRNFNGAIDEVAIYNKALSQSQLSALYAAGKSGLSGPVMLTNSWDGTSLTLGWPGNGVLLQATNVTGPWTTNGSSSPVTVNPKNGAPRMFYRVRVQ